MRPWLDRDTFPLSARQYLSDVILNLLIVAGTFALLSFGVRLFG
jgi:hypothetical protein